MDTNSNIDYYALDFYFAKDVKMHFCEIGVWSIVVNASAILILSLPTKTLYHHNAPISAPFPKSHLKRLSIAVRN